MEDQRKSLSKYAECYSQLPIIGTRYLTFRDVPDLIEEYVEGIKTLDYGCGPGQSTIFLKTLGLDVDGVDINEHMLGFAKQLDPDGNYSTISSGQIKCPQEQYDFVYAGFVLPYVSSINELLNITTEVSRVLKSGGTFIALTPNENTYKYKWLVENNDFEENTNLTSGDLARIQFQNLTLYHYYWTDEDYRDVMTRGGLVVVCAHNPYGKKSDGFPWVNEENVSPSTIYVAKKL